MPQGCPTVSPSAFQCLTNSDSCNTLAFSNAPSSAWPRAMHSGRVWESTVPAALGTAQELGICVCCHHNVITQNTYEKKKDKQNSKLKADRGREAVDGPQAFWVLTTLLFPSMGATWLFTLEQTLLGTFTTCSISYHRRLLVFVFK